MTIWITGATGLLGGWVRERLDAAGIATYDERVELTDDDDVTHAFERVKPRAIIHCAAMAAIADCARDPRAARAVNVAATARLAHLAVHAGARFVHVSTDLVFDGEAAPYGEGAATSPLSVYGATKVEAERAVLAAGGDAVVARVSLLYGPTRTARRSFFDATVTALREGDTLRLFDDEWRTPLSLRRAAEAMHLLATSDVTGVVHVGGPERMSRLAMGQRLAAHLGIGDASIEATSRSTAGGEPRPRDVSLDSSAFRARFAKALAGPDDFEAECRAMQA